MSDHGINTDKFKYKRSVAKARDLVREQGRAWYVVEELMEELTLAYSHIEENDFVKYCADIGLAPVTARRWIRKYSENSEQSSLCLTARPEGMS